MVRRHRAAAIRRVAREHCRDGVGVAAAAILRAGTLSRPRRFLKYLKPVLLALLAANTAWFAFSGTLSEAVDAGAWLTLLVLFEAEASFGDRLAAPLARMTVRLLRLAAAAGVVAATIGYLFEDDALDAVNAVLWLLVVALLELELRWPAAVARRRGAFAIAAGAIYGGLALLVLAWAASGMWFDAYDAALWLLAFGALELRLAKHVTPQARTSAA